MKSRFILAILFLILASQVYALGVAPAKTTVMFEPGTMKEGKLRIILDTVPKQITLKTEGELGKYIEIEKNNFVAESTETWVTFKINLPNELPPGERNGGILVSETPVGNENDVLYAVPAVVHKVITNVPYPGKYLTSKLFITNADKETTFTLAMMNWGQEKVEKAKATFIIKGPTNQELEVIHTEPVAVEPGKEAKLVSIWTTENPGNYLVEVALDYDGKIEEHSEIFTIGRLEIEIERIEVNDFKIGQIAKMDIYLRNKWNKPVKMDGRVEVTKNTKLISTFNTLPLLIPEKTTGTMEAYWNTQGIELGEYDVAVKVSYEGKTTEKTFSTYVAADSISIKTTGQAVKKTGSQNTILLSVLVLALIIVNIFLFIYINKKLKKPPSSG
jgi:hypothetical protein